LQHGQSASTRSTGRPELLGDRVRIAGLPLLPCDLVENIWHQ
jgi:hypothetical protein